MSEPSSSSSKKTIPERLDAELKNIPKFKPAFRNPARCTVADILGNSVEKAAFDEILGPLVNSRKNSLSKPLSERSTDGNYSSSNNSLTEYPKSHSEADFTATLLIRLADAEEETKSMRRQLVEKMGKINYLQSENSELRMRVNNPSMSYVDEMDKLRYENDRLESQISDMKDFLSDYGLVWVGKDNDSNQVDYTNKTDDGIIEGKVGVDYALFAKKVDELNSLQSSEPAQVSEMHDVK